MFPEKKKKKNNQKKTKAKKDGYPQKKTDPHQLPHPPPIPPRAVAVTLVVLIETRGERLRDFATSSRAELTEVPFLPPTQHLYQDTWKLTHFLVKGASVRCHVKGMEGN